MSSYLKGNIRTKHLLVLLSLLLACTLSMLIITADNVHADVVDSGNCGDNVTWVLDDEGTPDTYTLTISGTGAMTEYSGFRNIPWEPYHSKITKVVIGDGVTTVCNYAFYQCSALTDLSLPASLTTIGEQGFANCTELLQVTLPESLESIKNSAFNYCTKLKQVNIPGSLKELGGSAFRSCAELQGPLDISGCETIGTYAFSGCSALSAVTLPSNIEELPNNLFENCTSLNSIILPNSIKKLPNALFQGCTSLSNITLPSNIKEIPNNIFNRCTSLSSITIPEGVTKIGSYAFYSTALTSIVLPDSVTEIGDSAFSSCNSLNSVTFSNNIRSIGVSNEPLVRQAVDATATSELTVEISGYRPGIGNYAGQLQKITVMDGTQKPAGPLMYTFDPAGNLYEDADTSSSAGADDSIGQSTALSPKLYDYYAPKYNVTSFSCIVYKIEDHQLKKVAQGTKSGLIETNKSNGDELKSSLADLSVIMVEGETMTLGQILGRAGLAHVNCSQVRIPEITDFTDDQTAIVGMQKNLNTLRSSRFTAKSPGIVDANFKIYTQDCEYHGRQFSSSSPYDATVKLIVMGVPEDTPELRKITVAIHDIPDDLPEGSVVKVTLNGETKDVTITDGSGTAEFTGLDPDTEYPYSVDIGNDTTGYSRLYRKTRTLVPTVIIEHPQNLSWIEGDSTARSLSVSAIANDGGNLTYQWYKIDENGAEEAISGADSNTYNISNPEDMVEGTYKYFCRVSNSNDTEHPLDSDIATVTVSAKQPVTIGTEDKELTYNGEPITIPVEGMFDIPDVAGEATFTVTSGTGEGTYDSETGKLTITKAGTFTIKVNTAETDAYLAGEATATLTVNKAEGVAKVTLADQVAGTTDYEPTLASDNYGTAADDVMITYLKKEGDEYVELSEKPTTEGDYRVVVTFKENDLYVEKTVTADFKIGRAPVTIGTEDKELTYNGEPITIPVDGMFDIPEGAGEATYTVTPGTGEGTYDSETGKLTVTKAGTFTIQVNTAETDAYSAGEATATLTVNKAEGVAKVTLADQLVGTTDYEPTLESDNYSTNADDVTITYLKKEGDDYVELTEKPSEEGEYRVAVTFKENDLYVEKTVTADFKICTKPIVIGTEDKELTYNGEPIVIPVEEMFDIPDGAGEAMYTVIPGTGEGILDSETGMLTVTKAGTFTIQVNTAESATYSAGEAAATLTVNKAEGTATVTLADQVAGTTDYEPTLASDNYGTAADDVTITYLKKEGDEYVELTEKPTTEGEYRVAVTFKENDLYTEQTVTADFKITAKPISDITYDDLTDEEKADADKIVEMFDVDKDTAAKMLRTGEEMDVPLDTMLLSTKAIKELPNDNDPNGSRFAKLTARAFKRGKTTMRLQWKIIPQADGYLIYANKCGRKYKCELVKTVTNNTTNKWNRKKLKKATYYKYIVVAYKEVAGQKLPIEASVTVHCTTKAKKNTIAKTVKLNKKSLTLAVGETAKLKGKEVKLEKKKVIKRHRVVSYESLNPGIATVEKTTGKVTGVSAGTTKIYVYCQNGVYKKVTVTVE